MIADNCEDTETLQEKVDKCRAALPLTDDPIINRETLKRTKGPRADGTCEWIRENETYKSWLSGNSQGLWISGGPGKGKTMLSIFLTEELEKHTSERANTLLLFYFCSHQDEKRNSALAVLRNVLSQLVTKRQDLAEHILSHFESDERTKSTLNSPDALWIALRTLLQAPDLGNVFFVLDGLDECDETSTKLLVDNFCDFFQPDPRRPSRSFQLAIVSRTIAGLEVPPQVKLDPDNDKYVSGDIQHFISARIQKLDIIPGFGDICENVRAILLQRAQGTFLWIGFVVDELSNKRTCLEITESLDSFPPGLDAIYSRMLLQIPGDKRCTITRILRWVTMAVRPLTLQELTAAAAIPPSKKLSNDRVIRDHVILCGPILEIQGNEVRLIHESARDYFQRKEPDDDPILEEFRIKAEESHAELARKCLDYVEESDLSHTPLDTKDPLVLQKSPLLDYAVFHWVDHARRSSTYLDKDLSLSRPFFKRKSVVRMHWLNLVGWEERIVWKRSTFFQRLRLGQDALVNWEACTGWERLASNPLRFSSFFGIEPLARKLLKTPTLPAFHAFLGRRERSWALIIAARRGYKDVVKLLLANSIDINIKDRFGYTALILALERGYKDVVKLLLASGADANIGGKLFSKVLILAVRRGHENIVKLLLANSANVNSQDSIGNILLVRAAIRGHEDIVKLLLANGANANSQDSTGNIPLVQAAIGGHEDIVKLLLANGANANSQDSIGDTPLIWAAIEGHEDIVKLLLANGADINSKNKYGSSALKRAAARERWAVVRLLESVGATKT